MSFDHTQATEAEIQERLEKFKKRGSQVKDPVHYEKIVASFPPERQAEVRQAVPFAGKAQ